MNDKRIFIVEDNLENRIITRISLSRLEVRLQFDAWGRDTVRRLREFAPVDLIILDLMLGLNISGFQVFEEIRRHTEFAKVPIAAVSAAEAATALPKCRRLGFAGFISKPIDDDLFPQQITDLLNGKQVWFVR